MSRPVAFEEGAHATGTANTDYRGSASLGANVMAQGDVYIVRAWGQYNASGTSQTQRFRLYLNYGGGSQILLADSGVKSATSDGGNYEWNLEAMVAVRTSGASGTLWADGTFFDQGIGAQAGILAYNTNLDTTAVNTFELTGLVSANVVLTLRQALIARFQF